MDYLHSFKPTKDLCLTGFGAFLLEFKLRDNLVNCCPLLFELSFASIQVLPELQGRLHGIAARVPVPDGSVVDLFVKLGRDVSVEEVHAAVRAASESDELRGILEFSERPIVSSDIIGNSHSSIYDSGFSAVTGGRYLRVLNWYDNEWGYSCRVCDLLARIGGW
jgi:glyceraldehyde 3-phosphate dehydrogenase